MLSVLYFFHPLPRYRPLSFMTHVRRIYPWGLDIDPQDAVHEHARRVYINPGEPNFKPPPPSLTFFSNAARRPCQSLRGSRKISADTRIYATKQTHSMRFLYTVRALQRMWRVHMHKQTNFTRHFKVRFRTFH